MMNLQTARQRVSQMLTVWMTMLKLAWNQTTAALNNDDSSHLTTYAIYGKLESYKLRSKMAYM